MNIAGLVKSSLVDYPGLVCCVIFTPGCNFDCFYCHNRGLIDGTHNIIEINGVIDFLKKRKKLLDSVVISGGEPTLQKGLLDFMKIIKDMGYKLKLDTNGSSPETVSKLLETGGCDYFAVDYKCPKGKYYDTCGYDADKTVETINILLKYKARFEVRTTLFPLLTKEDLLIMAQELPVVPRYVLNRYRPPEKYKACDKDRIFEKALEKSEVDEIIDKLRVYQPNLVNNTQAL